MSLRLVDELCDQIKSMATIIYDQACLIEQSNIEDSIKKEFEKVRNDSKKKYKEIVGTMEG